MFCINCGKELPDRSRFCGYCGVEMRYLDDVTNDKSMTASSKKNTGTANKKTLWVQNPSKKRIARFIPAFAIMAVFITVGILIISFHNRNEMPMKNFPIDEAPSVSSLEENAYDIGETVEKTTVSSTTAEPSMTPSTSVTTPPIETSSSPNTTTAKPPSAAASTVPNTATPTTTAATKITTQSTAAVAPTPSQTSATASTTAKKPEIKEEQKKFSLITNPVGWIGKYDTVRVNGADTFVFSNSTGGYDSLFYIGKGHLERWRTEGTFAYDEVKGITSFEQIPHFNAGGYGSVVTGETFFINKIVRYDKAANRIITVKPENGYHMVVSYDGYIAYYERKDDEAAVIVVEDPQGNVVSRTKFQTPLYAWNEPWETKRSWNDFLWDRLSSFGGDYALFMAGTDLDTHQDCDQYYLDKKGNVVRLADEISYPRSTDWTSTMYMTVNLSDAVFCTHNGELYYYLLDDKRTYKFSAPDEILFNDKTWVHSNGGGECDFYGTKVISCYYDPNADTFSIYDACVYTLVDLASGKQSKPYLSMTTGDGKIFLVEDMNGNQGYIDSKGNELAFFDSAGEFIGDYAPVCKDNKVFLIDRNMNRVSEKIKGKKVTSLSEGLYSFMGDYGLNLMTYK